MITRVRDYSKKAPSRDAHKIYVICEGSATEPAYFKFFKGLSSNLEIIDVPSENGQTDPLKLKAWAENHLLNESPQYRINYLEGDTVWFVIDTDSWETEGKIKPLREFCAQLNTTLGKKYDELKPYKAWQVAQSNPCFEIWLYDHFYDTPPEDDEVEKYTSFKEYLMHVIAGGFNFEKDPARLETAIANSLKNYKREADGTLAPYATEMHEMGDEILRFVKKDLDILKNKLG